MATTLYFLRHSALAFVRGQDSKRHAHRAAQLTLGLDGEFRLHRDGRWESTRFAHLAPEESHHVMGPGSTLAYLFVDPGLRAYAAWCAGAGGPRAPSANTEQALRALARGARDVAAAARIAAQWHEESLAGLSSAAVGRDERIEQALARIELDPARAINHRELAALAHLSVSRFADRFRAATGMPVRNYLLWRRLLYSVQALQGGVSVTQAAHDAGFADAAHLSRSFRRILGAMPSDLLS